MDGPDLSGAVPGALTEQRRRRWLPSAQEARAAVAEVRFGSPCITWHVVRRNTAVTEDFADDIRDDVDREPGCSAPEDVLAGGGAGHA